MEEQSNSEYLDFLKWHLGRCEEIVAKIELREAELDDRDTEFLAAISNKYYLKLKLTE